MTEQERKIKLSLLSEKAKKIIFRLQKCATIQELKICWKENEKFVINDPEKIIIIEVKNELKGEFYHLHISEVRSRRVNYEWSLPLSEKKRLNELRIKQLKYYGIIKK